MSLTDTAVRLAKPRAQSIQARGRAWPLSSNSAKGFQMVTLPVPISRCREDAPPLASTPMSL